MKVSTLATWGMVSLLTLFILANWREENIYILPYPLEVRIGRVNLSIAFALCAAMGFATANLVRAMNKDKGDKKK